MTLRILMEACGPSTMTGNLDKTSDVPIPVSPQNLKTTKTIFVFKLKKTLIVIFFS